MAITIPKVVNDLRANTTVKPRTTTNTATGSKTIETSQKPVTLKGPNANPVTAKAKEETPTPTTTDPGGFNGGTTEGRPTADSTDPYILAAQQGNQAYYDAYMSRLEALKAQAQTQYTSANSSYDRSAKNTYGNYLEALKNQKASASNNGMTGGAVERMRVDSSNNYNKGYAASEAGRAKTLAGIQSNYDASSSEAYVDYKNQTTQNLYNARVASQEAAERKAADEAARKLEKEKLAEEKRQYEESRKFQEREAEKTHFANTVTQYNSRKSVEKAIKKLKKSDPLYSYKLDLLNVQLSKFKKKKK